MSNFTSDARLFVYPFTRQSQGGEVVVGRPETGTFLAMPPDALELLDWLAQGKTVGEVQELYQAQHGEVPDLPDFLGYMERKGFIRMGSALPPGPSSAQPKVQHYHFEWIPRSFAQVVFSKPVLTLYGALFALAVAAILRNPHVLPSRNALYFEHHRSLYALSLMVIGCLAVFLHEMGHLLAARALGVSSRLSIGHRLWVVVAETDLTGLWSVPKQKRYLPILAGPIVDMISASFLVLILFARQVDWISLGPVASKIIPAVLFGYLIRLYWQFFFFVRTDVYYLITTYFDCKNLLKDTEMFLRRQAAHLIRGVRYVDQDAIPEAERRVIRAYSVVWLIGRGFAFSALLFVTIPLTFRYLSGVHATLSGGFSSNPYEFLDSIVFVFLSLGPMLFGMWLWIGSLVRGRLRKAV